jgi:hypothetical protein
VPESVTFFLDKEQKVDIDNVVIELPPDESPLDNNAEAAPGARTDELSK